MNNEEKILNMLEEKQMQVDRIDRIESDIIVLKNAVKMLTQEIAELKKAQ